MKKAAVMFWGVVLLSLCGCSGENDKPAPLKCDAGQEACGDVCCLSGQNCLEGKCESSVKSKLAGTSCESDTCEGNISLYCHDGVYEIWKVCEGNDICATFSHANNGVVREYTDCFKSCASSEIGNKGAQCDEDKFSKYSVETECMADKYGKLAYIFTENSTKCDVNCKSGICQKIVDDEQTPCDSSFKSRCDGEIAVQCEEQYDQKSGKTVKVVTAVDCSLYYGQSCIVSSKLNMAKCLEADAPRCEVAGDIIYECDDQYFESYGDYDIYKYVCISTDNQKGNYLIEESMLSACGSVCDETAGTCE